MCLYTQNLSILEVKKADRDIPVVKILYTSEDSEMYRTPYRGTPVIFRNGKAVLRSDLPSPGQTDGHLFSGTIKHKDSRNACWQYEVVKNGDVVTMNLTKTIDNPRRFDIKSCQIDDDTFMFTIPKNRYISVTKGIHSYSYARFRFINNDGDKKHFKAYIPKGAYYIEGTQKELVSSELVIAFELVETI